MAGKAKRRGWGHVRRLPSKRYQASYTGPDLQRHTAPITFTAKTDAEHWLAEERRLVERSEWTPPKRRAEHKKAKGYSLSEYGPRWIEQRTKGGEPLKPRTKSHYLRIFTEHIEPTLGPLTLRNITDEAVQNWHRTTLVGKPTYRAHAYSLLHAILASAVDDDLIDSNPAKIKGAARSTRKRTPQILDIPDVALLAGAIRPERFKALILISAWIGTRWGETTELRRRDINKDASIITVERGVVHRDGRCVISTPKSGHARHVVVPPHIRPAITEHLNQWTGKGPDALLFPPARGGCHIRDKVFRELYYSPALKAADIDKQPTLHDLRHFSGTQTARVGNLSETMARLGHRTVQASMLYQGIASGRDVAVAEALSRLALGQDTPGT